MSDQKANARLEAFSDGVFAFALTLLIVDIKIPPTASINNTAEFWLALGSLAPSMFAFILSFIVILITWANHHAALEMIDKSSAFLIYANGFLLLTIVIIPFPTALVGEYLATDHAAPAVVLYDSTLALQAVGWILLTRAALHGQLYRNGIAASKILKSRNFGHFAFGVYVLCAIAAFWFPLTIAVTTTSIWIFWLIWGINVKQAQVD